MCLSIGAPTKKGTNNVGDERALLDYVEMLPAEFVVGWLVRKSLEAIAKQHSRSIQRRARTLSEKKVYA